MNDGKQIERLLVRPAEAAAMLGVSRSKIYELINSGAVPSVRLEDGRLIRIPLQVLRRIASVDGGESDARDSRQAIQGRR